MNAAAFDTLASRLALARVVAWMSTRYNNRRLSQDAAEGLRAIEREAWAAAAAEGFDHSAKMCQVADDYERLAAAIRRSAQDRRGTRLMKVCGAARRLAVALEIATTR